MIIKEYNYIKENKNNEIKRSVILMEIKKNEVYQIITREKITDKISWEVNNYNFTKYNKAKALELFENYYTMYLALENEEIAQDFE